MAEPADAPVVRADTAPDDERDRTRKFLSRSEMWFVLAISGFIAVGLLVAAFFAQANAPSDTEKPALLLPLLLTLGVILLIATLGAYAIVLHGIGLSPEAPDSQALGLPEGSVRAVLALALVLVFAILSVFLFIQLQNPPQLQSSGVTAEQLPLFGQGQVVQIKPDAASSPATYTVVVAPGAPGSTQVAQQLVTVLATLVTAVAAFYFGASTVKEAHAAATKEAGGETTSAAVGGKDASTDAAKDAGAVDSGQPVTGVPTSAEAGP